MSTFAQLISAEADTLDETALAEVTDKSSYQVKIPLQFDFREKQSEYQYVDYMDVAQNLGGFNSFFTGILQILAPFGCLAFHTKLANILREQAAKAQREHTLEYLKIAEENLKAKEDEESKEYLSQVTSTIKKLEILNKQPVWSFVENFSVTEKFKKYQIPQFVDDVKAFLKK